MSLIGNLKKCSLTYQRAPSRARPQKKEYKKSKEYEEFKESFQRGSWLLILAPDSPAPLLELLVLLVLLELL